MVFILIIILSKAFILLFKYLFLITILYFKIH